MLQGPAGNLSHPAKADVSNKWLVGHSVHTWHLAQFFLAQLPISKVNILIHLITKYTINGFNSCF